MTQLIFCGATVIGASLVHGWGSQNVSTLNVDLIDDPINNYYFVVPPIGCPVTFTAGTFIFCGLFQRFEKIRQSSGFVYKVVCEDPRGILANAELIVGGCSASTFNMPNVLNCFGYAEQGGNNFGGSLSNESGMPWYIVKQGIQGMTASLNSTAWGGPLINQGVAYAVDLSEVPDGPSYYRLNSSANINILAAIEQVCGDACMDFYVELIPNRVRNIIKVRTVSRYAQPPLGTIDKLVGSGINSGTLISGASGLEAVKDQPTSAFVIGGNKTLLYGTNNIVPYFGFYPDGSPVRAFKHTPLNGQDVAYFDCWAANIDASPIAGCFNNGRNTYFLSEIEMRFALVSQAEWETYVGICEPAKGRQIGPFGLQPPNLPNAAAQNNAQFINFAAAIGHPEQQTNNGIVYNFILEKARNWLGRKFWVSLPFLLSYTDPETLQVKDSYSVATDGAYLESGSAPSGLNVLNEDQFTTPDGRFISFAKFNNIFGADLSQISDDCVIQGRSLYAKLNVDTTIVLSPYPMALAELSSPVWAQTADREGDGRAVSWLYNNPNAGALAQQQGGFNPLNGGGTCHPNYIPPNIFNVALRDNVAKYGPWLHIGVPGKVAYTNDDSLTPWNYGGYDLLNKAGQFIATSQVSLLQVAESGHYEVPGFPTVSTGQSLQAGGPEVTNIEISFGTSGVNTKYQMRTWTGSFGTFSRSKSDQLRKLGQVQQQLRKSLRISLNQQINARQVARQVQQRWMQAAPPWVIPRTPHPVIVSQVYNGPNGLSVSTALSTIMEAPAYMGLQTGRIDLNKYKNSALTGLSALIIPFSFLPNTLMPQAKPPTINVLTSCVNASNLNLFKPGINIDFLAYGEGRPNMQGPNAFSPASAEQSSIRGVSLRGPVWLTGFGYRLTLERFPTTSGNDITNYETGPVDLLFDPWRKVWTSHDIIVGKLTAALAAGGTATCNVFNGDNVLGALTVKNWFTNAGATLPINTRVIIGYDMMNHCWRVIAGDCPS